MHASGGGIPMLDITSDFTNHLVAFWVFQHFLRELDEITPRAKGLILGLALLRFGNDLAPGPGRLSGRYRNQRDQRVSTVLCVTEDAKRRLCDRQARP